MDLSKFSQSAREALDVAMAVVRRGRSNVLGTEHILFGLLAQQGSVVHRILEELGPSLMFLQAKTNDVIRLNDISRPRTTAEQIQPSANARRSLRRAIEEAEQAAGGPAGTEHLLLGLISLDECAAAGVLREADVSETDVRRAIGKLQKEGVLGAGSDSLLLRHGRDITQLAREGKLDPVVGREEEIKRMIQILARRTKNNPAIIGEPGVGKTSIVEGLAQKIARGYVPEVLKDKVVISLDLGSLVAGTRFRGDFEERLKGVIEEVKASSGKVILFVDEFHHLVGTGGAEGAMDAGKILKPALATSRASRAFWENLLRSTRYPLPSSLSGYCRRRSRRRRARGATGRPGCFR